MSGAVTYNLFRHGIDPAILCAVPNDKPVPTFIVGPAWCFEKTVRIDEPPAESFRPTLATVAANLNGFYLFLAFRRAFHDPWLPAPSFPRLAA